jgi:hypothetical protein
LPGKSAKRVFTLDDPAIHLLRKKRLAKMMDARIKSGHDESGGGDASEEPWEEMDDRQSSVEPYHGPVKFSGWSGNNMRSDRWQRK